MNKQYNVTALIAARMGSSRFPGKTLADLHGEPMLARLVERISYSKYISSIVVATTDLDEDTAIDQWCQTNSINCYRGSATDVLGRLLRAAEQFNCSTIVEILGDNPLVHSSMIDAAVDLFISEKQGYVATLTNEYPKVPADLNKFPIGIRVQVFSLETLKKCAAEARLDRYREHATSYIAEHPDRFKAGYIEAGGEFGYANRPELTFAVNQEKNLELIRNIFAECYNSDHNFELEKVINVYNQNPVWNQLMGN